MAGRSCHCFLLAFTGIGLLNHGHESTECTFFDSSLLKGKKIIYLFIYSILFKQGSPNSNQSTVFQGAL